MQKVRWAALVLLGLVIATPSAAAWRASIAPEWSSPDPGAPWTFSLSVTNAGNASMSVVNISVWTDWPGGPTSASPAATTTPVPVVVEVGVTAHFSFTIDVPASEAGTSHQLSAQMWASNPDGSGWTSPGKGSVNDWAFSVRSSPSSGSGGSGSASLVPFYILFGLIIVIVWAVAKVRGVKSRKQQAQEPYPPPNWGPEGQVIPPAEQQPGVPPYPQQGHDPPQYPPPP